MGRPILPRRIPAAALDGILAAISEGWQTTEDAFMEAGISRSAVQYALRDGRAADDKWESGSALTAAENELRGFYLKVEAARAKQNAVLRRLAFGSPKVSGDIYADPKSESPAATRTIKAFTIRNANRLHAGHASTAVSQSALVHLSDSIEPRSIPTGNSKLGMLNPLFVTHSNAASTAT